jgi:hypothetical protein
LEIPVHILYLFSIYHSFALPFPLPPGPSNVFGDISPLGCA